MSYLFSKDVLTEEYTKLNTIRFSNQVSKAYKLKYEEDFDSWLKAYKMAQKRVGRRRTIKQNILKKGLQWYATITFKDDYIKDFNTDKFRKLLNRYKIDYYFIRELGGTNKRLHMHGFINCDFSLVERLVIKGKKINDRYGNAVYTIPVIAKNTGYMNMVNMSIKDKKTKNKMINYIIKYILEQDFKAMSNRTIHADTNYTRAVDFFGKELVKIEW